MKTPISGIGKEIGLRKVAAVTVIGIGSLAVRIGRADLGEKVPLQRKKIDDRLLQRNTDPESPQEKLQKTRTGTIDREEIESLPRNTNLQEVTMAILEVTGKTRTGETELEVNLEIGAAIEIQRIKIGIETGLIGLETGIEANLTEIVLETNQGREIEEAGTGADTVVTEITMTMTTKQTTILQEPAAKRTTRGSLQKKQED